MVTFGAVGDICLARTCGRHIEKNGEVWPFELMRPFLDRADLLFGNMESVVLPPDYPEEQIDPEGLVSKFDASGALKVAGFDILNMASNHILDGGPGGMFHTRNRIEALGIATAGVGQTQQEARQMRVLEAGGLRFGFLCYCEDNNYTCGTMGPCHAYYVPEIVLEDIAASKSRVDVLVVSVHADLEYMETPSVPRREDFRRFARAGATLVLGHHPHVPQGVEQVDGALIVYSLGNFFFFPHNMPYHRNKLPHTAHSFLLLAEVSRDGVESFTRVPFEIQNPPNVRPGPLEGRAAEQLLAYLTELDRWCGDDDRVKSNWRHVAMDKLEGYLAEVKAMDRDDRTWRGRALRRLEKCLGREDRVDIDRILQEYLGPLLFVAENQSWMNEILQAVKEKWAAHQRQVDPYHRPEYALSRRQQR